MKQHGPNQRFKVHTRRSNNEMGLSEYSRPVEISVSTEISKVMFSMQNIYLITAHEGISGRNENSLNKNGCLIFAFFGCINKIEFLRVLQASGHLRLFQSKSHRSEGEFEDKSHTNSFTHTISFEKSTRTTKLFEDFRS